MKFRLRMGLLVEDHHSVSSCLEKYTCTQTYTHTHTHTEEKREGGREGERQKGAGEKERERNGQREEIGPTQVKSDRVDELRGQ